MQGEKKKRWMELCELAAVEQDPKKLLQLVKEINNLLKEKEQRLGIIPPEEIG
jgi:predicted Zn-ribbon and HTH transcriptional regulator